MPFLAILALLSSAATSSPAATAAELVARLAAPATREAAWAELERRRPRSELELETDESLHLTRRLVGVVLCPQVEAPPLTLAIARYGAEGEARWNDEAPIGPSLDRHRDLSLTLFTAAGERLQGLSGLRDGVLEDLDSDGLIEIADRRDVSVSGAVWGQVLEIHRIRRTPEAVFAVLYNFGSNEWDYRLTASPDGPRIELGPLTPKGFEPRVVYSWDPSSRRWSGPAEGEHFHVLRPVYVDEDVDSLAGEGRFFTPDPTAGGSESRLERRSPAVERLVEAARPYAPCELSALSDDELLLYMAGGRDAWHVESETLQDHLPDRFWTRPPHDATVALADTNRRSEHRTEYALHVDEEGGPPHTPSAVAVFWETAPCYVKAVWHLFLRVDPERSYLAQAGTTRAGTVFRDPADDPTVYDLRLADVSYADARHVADVLAWLGRLKSAGPGRGGASSSFSTASMPGHIELLDTGGTPRATLAGTTWGSVSYDWNGELDGDVIFNLALYLLSAAIPERLGSRWTTQAPRSVDVTRHDIARAEDAGEVRRTAATARELTALARRGPAFLSREVLDIARAALADSTPAKVAARRAASAAAALAREEEARAARQRLDEAGLGELLSRLVDGGAEGAERRQDMARLAPPEDPLRYPDSRVDEVLKRLLESPRAPYSDALQPLAARAIALRGQPGAFEDISAAILRIRGPRDEDALAALTLLAARGTRAQRTRLVDLLAPELDATDRMLEELFLDAWAADLRELEHGLARVATGGPEDVEGWRAHTSGGEVEPVKGRYHLARKVLAIWDEKDVATRAKLLVALAYTEPFYPMGWTGQVERTERLHSELTRTLTMLSPAERSAIEAFHERCERLARAEPELPEQADPRAIVREALRRHGPGAREPSGAR